MLLCIEAVSCQNNFGSSVRPKGIPPFDLGCREQNLSQVFNWVQICRLVLLQHNDPHHSLYPVWKHLHFTHEAVFTGDEAQQSVCENSCVMSGAFLNCEKITLLISVLGSNLKQKACVKDVELGSKCQDIDSSPCRFDFDYSFFCLSLTSLFNFMNMQYSNVVVCLAQRKLDRLLTASEL